MPLEKVTVTEPLESSSLFAIHPSLPDFNTDLGHVKSHQGFDKFVIISL